MSLRLRLLFWKADRDKFTFSFDLKYIIGYNNFQKGPNMSQTNASWMKGVLIEE